MERRNFLKTAGGIGAATAIGGTGLFMLTGGATATSLGFTAPSVEMTFDDGRISAVTVEINNGELKWEGLNFDATDVELTLQAGENGQYDDLSSKSITDDERVGNAKAGSVNFSMGPVDVLQSEYYDAEDFAAEEDGEENETTVNLRLNARVNTENQGYHAKASGKSNLNVKVNNRHKSASGEADATYVQSFGGTVYDHADEPTDYRSWLRVYYAEDGSTMRFEMDLSEYNPLIDDDNPELNGAIGLDVDDSGIGDYQFGWLEHDDNHPDFAYQTGDEDGWSGWKDVEDYNFISAERTGDVISFTVDRAAVGLDGSEQMFRTGLHASAGGNAEYTFVADDDDPEKGFWSENHNWASSEHFIRTETES